jgi:uncharacterized protein YecT (DUF1311 family)
LIELLIIKISVHSIFFPKETTLKISALFASIILCFLMATSASAQSGRAPAPCDNAETTVEMRDCAGKEYKKADAELNSAYKRLMSKLTDSGHQSSLKTAQQAWIKYRDANCEFEAYLNRGGTIYPVVYTGCLSAMTMNRTKELRELIEQQEEQ